MPPLNFQTIPNNTLRHAAWCQFLTLNARNTVNYQMNCIQLPYNTNNSYFMLIQHILQNTFMCFCGFVECAKPQSNRHPIVTPGCDTAIWNLQTSWNATWSLGDNLCLACCTSQKHWTALGRSIAILCIFLRKPRTSRKANMKYINRTYLWLWLSPSSYSCSKS